MSGPRKWVWKDSTAGAAHTLLHRGSGVAAAGSPEQAVSLRRDLIDVQKWAKATGRLRGWLCLLITPWPPPPQRSQPAANEAVCSSLHLSAVARYTHLVNLANVIFSVGGRTVQLMARIHYEIPDDLHRRAKSAASLQGVTLKDFVVAALELATNASAPKQSKPRKAR